ncbi:hypothetical protein [Glycomyces buryatensis]|uniref:Uncharacterized protein n=1 Tax=Glycomyces buryatensis TaxID=2570927 RepID=A0A4S8QKF3_9ACTN|nr:hypothetical protein [Glycomyces buryatensis]THV41224.1 hypothetical protein FAB82_12375 [Glycomyces buryatensis]
MSRAVPTRNADGRVKRALRLRFLASACIEDRRLRFEPVPGQARLRIAISGSPIETGTEAEVLGSVTGLDTGTAKLTVSAPLHVEWATDNRDQILTEAVRVWAEITRECDG